MEEASMAERQVLEDAIDVGCSQDADLSDGSAAFRALALHQVPSARASEQDLASAGYLESFGYGFAGLDSFGASHVVDFVTRFLALLLELGLEQTSESVPSLRCRLTRHRSSRLFLGVRFQALHNRLLG